MYVGVEIWGRHRGVCRSGDMGEAQRCMWEWSYGGGTEVCVGVELWGRHRGVCGSGAMGEAQRCM